MSRCRHLRSRMYVGGMTRHICIDCGHWLPLGPANDTPEVLVEVRAAAIAADWDNYMNCGGWQGFETLGACTPDAGHAPFIESDIAAGRKPAHDITDYYAGHLARCIAIHEEEQTP